MMSDPFIPISKPLIGAREKELVLEALDSGWVSSIGKYIDEFEANFARYCGTEYALAVSNGTTGLHLALATLGLGPGDEVIIPDLTFVATANAVAYTGAKPVLADIDGIFTKNAASITGLPICRRRSALPSSSVSTIFSNAAPRSWAGTPRRLQPPSVSGSIG